jgi:hypothetical protein
MKSNNSAPTNTINSANANSTPALRRGMKKADVVKLVEKFNFPAKPFTLKEIIHAFGVDHWYIVDFVKRNGTIVGDAPKSPGVRGKAAKLYSLNAGK